MIPQQALDLALEKVREAGSLEEAVKLFSSQENYGTEQAILSGTRQLPLLSTDERFHGPVRYVRPFCAISLRRSRLIAARPRARLVFGCNVIFRSSIIRNARYNNSSCNCVFALLTTGTYVTRLILTYSDNFTAILYSIQHTRQVSRRNSLEYFPIVSDTENEG